MAVKEIKLSLEEIQSILVKHFKENGTIDPKADRPLIWMEIEPDYNDVHHSDFYLMIDCNPVKGSSK